MTIVALVANVTLVAVVSEKKANESTTKAIQDVATAFLRGKGLY